MSKINEKEILHIKFPPWRSLVQFHATRICNDQYPFHRRYNSMLWVFQVRRYGIKCPMQHRRQSPHARRLVQFVAVEIFAMPSHTICIQGKMGCTLILWQFLLHCWGTILMLNARGRGSKHNFKETAAWYTVESIRTYSHSHLKCVIKQ